MIGAAINLVRGAWVGFVLAREGALAFADPSEMPAHLRLALKLGRSIERKGIGDGAARLSAAMTRLGPSYVKFGQFLATRPDIVGMRAAMDLEKLQDRVPPFPQATAIRVVEAAFGKPISSLFVSFSEPIAAHPSRRFTGPWWRMPTARAAPSR